MDKIEALKAKIAAKEAGEVKTTPNVLEEEKAQFLKQILEVCKVANDIQYKGIEKRLEAEFKKVHARFDLIEKMIEEFLLKRYQ